MHFAISYRMNVIHKIICISVFFYYIYIFLSHVVSAMCDKDRVIHNISVGLLVSIIRVFISLILRFYLASGDGTEPRRRLSSCLQKAQEERGLDLF